jgi:hypothetical protein
VAQLPTKHYTILHSWQNSLNRENRYQTVLLFLMCTKFVTVVLQKGQIAGKSSQYFKEHVPYKNTQMI